MQQLFISIFFFFLLWVNFCNDLLNFLNIKKLQYTFCGLQFAFHVYFSNLVDALVFFPSATSLSAKVNDFTCYSFVQEPFKSLPILWTIHEQALATRSRKYSSNRQIELFNDWKRLFSRSTVVVFPNYFLPVRFRQSLIL